MSRIFVGGYEDLDSDENVTEDYDETHGVPRKNWIGPSKVSLQQLDKVRPAATVYNLGLRDPSDLKPGRGKTPLVSTHDQLSDLQAEPPLSTVSYQKAAWGSETSIPDVLKQAAQAGTRPSRPSSAKTGSIAKQPLSRKSRPQSAKDPLCPNGKIKAAKLGVKGQKFDPSDRYARSPLPHSATPLGWAGPPAGLCNPSDDSAINSVQAVNAGKHAPVPPPPNTSPEPTDLEDAGLEFVPESPPPSPGLHLSFSLPSADADDGDEPDTGRLLAEADLYVKKKKEVQKIRYFKADSMVPGKIGESLKTSIGFLQEGHANTTETPAPADLDSKYHSDCDIDTEPIEEELDENMSYNCVPHHTKKTSISDQTVDNCNHTEESLHLDFTSGDGSSGASKPLPPTNGFDLKYLGPTASKQENKNWNHPIFLMPDKKQKNTCSHQTHSHSRPRPQSAESEDSAVETKLSRSVPEAGRQAPTCPSAAKAQGEKSSPRTTATRAGVHICEDRNTTVDITPRNIGRKVMTGKLSRKYRAPFDLDMMSESLLKEESSGHATEDVAPRLEVAATPVKAQAPNHTSVRPTTPAAAPISVFYDDDDDESSVKMSDKKKKKRPRPVKEADLVTMVSNVSLSDEEDDPGREVNIEVGEGKGDTQLHRPSSALSNGERNYYDIARKHAKTGKKDTTFISQEEKENFITVTTKLILFDTEKPTESVVKTILEAPQAKEKVAVTIPEKLPPRPKSSCRSRSTKLSKSEHVSVAPSVSPKPPVSSPDGDNEENEGGFTCKTEDPEDLERPWSRMGFFNMDSNRAAEDSDDGKGSSDKKEGGQHEVKHRPPSGKRRPLSATFKTPNRSTPTPDKQKSKEALLAKRRPLSASSAIDRRPCSADIHRANAAAQALRSQREATAKAGPRFNQTRRNYAAYSRSSGHGRARSASLTRKPVQIVSKNPDLEIMDSEEMKECRDIQNRLACYGIDVKPETLERALYPPTGKTLYYEINADLPKSFSTGLLSHPRYWLPEEHRKLKLAEKKLAMVELSLWKQKKEEERKERLAAGKVKSKKGKKKGKKKLTRSQSVC